ncbi:MAG: orotate phosphoribosyltransferase [Alphaproteobacteria bacterium]|jgi:orotate phosphoribosyltransferase|nr:orotate phosphoribosyltransferase [Alphaproteobacteria bacterium]MBT5860465.1 orotate phosphoribosyltransferase [Alphaproteobacteria bacterium]
MSDQRQQLRDLVDAKSLKRGDFTLASGAKSTFYFNMKETLFDPDGANLIADLILDEIADDGAEFVGGLEMGAVPIAACVAMRSAQIGRPIRGFYIRKQAKDHGVGKRIDVDLTPGANVVVVEDVTTSGGSVLQAIEVIRAEGCVVAKCITILDRDGGATELLADAGVELVPLLRSADFDLT